jgi:hypothetical protein
MFQTMDLSPHTYVHLSTGHVLGFRHGLSPKVYVLGTWSRELVILDVVGILTGRA